MGLNFSPKITCDYVLSHVDEAQVFFAYFGEFDLKKTYKSVFRKDENPSTGFYIGVTGKLIYNDIATGEKLDCFAFVAKLFGISYAEALRKVACDFGVIECEGVTKIKKGGIRKSKLVSEQLKQETDIKIIADDWEEEYVHFWREFSITTEELTENKVYPVKRLEINGVNIPNYSKNVRFAYTLEHEGKIYKKIYTPYARNKKFKWINNIPIYLPFGFSSLPYTSKTLIITKAQKDRIIFKKYFTDVIAIQNESPASLRDTTINYLKKRYKRILINTDIDNAGLNAAKFYEEKGLEPLLLPEVCYERYNVKDVGDLVSEFGIDRFEGFLKYKELI